jgi:hypothetical protein
VCLVRLSCWRVWQLLVFCSLLQVCCARNSAPSLACLLAVLATTIYGTGCCSGSSTAATDALACRLLGARLVHA